MQTFVYQRNGIVPWVMGLTSWAFRRTPKSMYEAAQMQGGKFVWRNTVPAGYKISNTFSESPMDLSNYMLLKTREYMLLTNKVHHPDRVLKSSSSRFAQVHKNGLQTIEKELEDHVPNLLKMVHNFKGQDVPVAFATNTLYVLAKLEAGDASALLPVLKAKAEWLHAEGVSQAIWALSKAEIWDEELWSILAKKAVEHDLDITFVKNQRWSVSYFQELSGSEHYFEKELGSLAHDLFFRDHLCVYELYHGLVAAHEKNASLGLGETVEAVKEKYKSILTLHEEYKVIDANAAAVWAE